MSTWLRRVTRPKTLKLAISLAPFVAALAIQFVVDLYAAPALILLALGALISLRRVNARWRQNLHERRVFAAVVEASSDFIAIAGKDGRPRYVNPAGRRLVGLGPDEPVDHGSVLDVCVPEHRDAVSAMNAAAAARDHADCETELRNATTGEATPVSLTRVTIRDPDTGRVLGAADIARDISKAKCFERSLRVITDDFARAQAVACVGSWRFDDRRETRDWSDETFRILGLPLDTPAARELYLAAVHPDDRAYRDAQWNAALEGATYDLDHRIVVGGVVRWVHAKAELQFDERGQLIGGIGTIQDVTDRRRLEDDLRAAEARASGILSISADAIISVDDSQRITMFNEGAQRIFGYSKDEAIGQPVSMLIPARLRERHAKHVAAFATGTQSARTMSTRSVAIVGLRKNGEEFAADASISRLEINGLRTLTVSVRDISDQKRLETEQRLLVELGTLLGSSLDFDQTVGNLAGFAVEELADCCVIDFVEAVGELTRVRVACRDPAHQWIRDTFARVQLGAGRPHIAADALAARRSVLLPDIPADVLESFAHDDAHLAALRALDPRSLIAIPLTVGGTLLGAMILLRSRTTPRAYDDKDLRFAEEVARRAAFSLENAKLYRTARRAIQSRDEVLGVVAHDLRNPLNSIMLYNELIAKEAPAPIQKSAAAIDRAATRMKRLIEDLVEVTRLEGGDLALDRRPISTAQLVHDAADAQRPLARAAELELVVDVALDTPGVLADRDRVTQILENLVGNAIKFTEHGRITIGAARRGSEVLFWVADTGTGIEVADQPHVFDRFWQRREYRRRGAGLGLAIAKGLVEAHGGRIWLDSAVGRGTTFYFTIAATIEQLSHLPSHGA